MSQLTKLKSATTLQDVAALFGFKLSAISYILYKKDGGSKYTTFEIPKRYGGTRKICAPSASLKLLQRRLADLLQNCVSEINEANGLDDKISHGFKRKRSIITNAKCHRNRRHVFNVDLQDFFGTINFGRVRGFFIKDKNFALNPKVATVLAQIACHENSLPQGSPCSPVISNLIGHVLDVHLVRLASRLGCTYSRYADDLTFSTNLQNFPTSIACPGPTKDDNHKWLPGKELVRLVTQSGFALNPQKTRMQYRDSRQEVTGLVVNRKVNVRSEYRHTVRAMVHRLFTTGTFAFIHKVVDAKGVVTLNETPGSLNQLHGMLGFIDGIDLYNRNLNLRKDHKTKAQPYLSTKESMYRRFLLFKEFFTAKTPVIICEGRTDNVYLVHAIRSLAASYPQLTTVGADGAIKLNIRIYKYSGTSTGRILGVSGGSSPLSKLIHTYRSESQKFTAPGNQNPVVLLIDNDKGAGPIYSTIKEIAKSAPTGTEPFIHVFGNLYVVATPRPPGKKESKIEDFFDSSVTATTIGGKTFDPSDDYDSETCYGKVVFAHKVVRPHADTIDFSGFNGILSNLVSVIEEHAKKCLPPV